MKLYNFMRLITKYSVTFHLHKSAEGKYEAGKWVKDEPEITEMNGAIVPINERKIYDSGGTYSTQDRELYVITPLPMPLSELSVVYNGNKYSVEESKNFEDYADVAI